LSFRLLGKVTHFTRLKNPQFVSEHVEVCYVIGIP